MTIDLYYVDGSGPCRSVLLVAKALGLELNLIVTDLMNGQNRTPEYLKMNPQHTVPFLNDNGFYLTESRAINMYLANKYGKDDTLYPKDLEKRARVDQRLFFDSTTLYSRLLTYYFPIIFEKATGDPEKKKKFEEALEFMNAFLEGQDFVAGPNLTIADLAIVATISTAEAADCSVSKFANVQSWYERVQKKAPGYEVNVEGTKSFRQFFLGGASTK